MRVILLLLIAFPVLGFSQQVNCISALDTAEVIKIAKKKKAYWQVHEQMKPDIVFDVGKCEWIVKSSKTKHTNRGNCKNTNGCTLLKTVTLTIDARTIKIKHKRRRKKLYHNYE